MSRTLTLTVRLDGPLADFVAAQAGDGCAYPSAGAYVRDLVRRDRERVESDAFERLKAELSQAFAAPERPTSRCPPPR